MFTSRPFLQLPSLSLVSAYLRKEFLRLFFLSLLLFLFLAVLVDFFDRLDYLVKYQATATTVLLYFIFKIPLFITQAAPVAALVAALISVGLLSRNREITALKACGISQWQIAKPFLFAAGLLSFGLWMWNETVVPHAYRQSRYINLKIKKRTPKPVFHENGFWYHGDNVFYHIDHFDSRTNILSGLTIYVIDKNFQILALFEAPQASWQNGQWRFEGLQEKSLSLAGDHTRPLAQPLLQETPEDFTLVDIEPDEFSSQQLRDYIRDLQRKGLDTTAYQVDLRLKVAMPTAVFAMALLGIALAVPGAGQLSLATAVGLALMGGFGYWLLLALTVSLGHSGVISPVLAAWSANGLSILLGVFFLLGVD
ncbi:MAG TPA: LPS export ABC transporter permease LptG [Methylomirabilota bacterium]|nr:LPS export ABC transporter permease LptG [Methylomirabilota bacterium]HZT34676.1 LPS export ABC transporter permease LptG [Nitrososphaera sp.]